ncbi:Wzz/FepE/Etk N-terminal domain-containing protein [Psychrobacillus sp. PGGUH221]|uniref:Wzz/FepE/Etk N-terminal domain-containing protein n=1 Tax=Psychrobacillus sp. PGGUH221 TaxID=3020058 RepID=UPI0035C66AFA
MNEETISLRELVEIVWNGKKIIILSMVVSILIATVLSFIVLDKKYVSEATVQVTANTNAEGIVKQYIDSEFTSQVFAERMKNQAFIDQIFNESGKKVVSNKNLAVNVDVQTNMISLSYTSGSSDGAQKILSTLIDEQKKYMSETLTNEFTLLADSYTKESERLSNEIRDLIKLYNETIKTNNLPEILILQSMIPNELIIDLSTEQQATLVNIDGALQNELMQLQAKISSKSEEYRKVLDQYQSVLTNIESFRPDPLIKTVIAPTLPETPSSPNTLLNSTISIVLGAIIGLGIVFFRKYWTETNPVEK